MSFLLIFAFYLLGSKILVSGTSLITVPNPLNNTDCQSDQLICGEKCYEMSQYCDGIKDCKDSSDEPIGCTPIPKEKQCRKNEQFTCKKTHQCIPIIWMCDGERDCGSPNNIDNSDEQLCYKSINEPILLVSRVYEISGVLLERPFYHVFSTIRAPEVLHAQQIEYLAKNFTIYFADTKLNAIKRFGLTNELRETIIDSGINISSGLAVDFLANLLFVGSLEGITVYNLNGEYSSIIIKNTHVLSVAINPMKGELFFISTNKTTSSIEMSLMDGSKRKPLITNPVENFLSYLTFDKDDYRLYWISNYQINYYDLSQGTVNILNLPYQSRVIAFTVYKNSVYYANDIGRDNYSIFKVDKTTGKDDILIRKISKLLSFRIYDPFEQNGKGACDKNKNGCDHLCVPISSIKSRCICAIGYKNDPNDSKKCLADSEFIFYSQSKEIHGLKMNENGSFDEVALAPISKISMANSIDYLAEEDLIFWVDDKKGIISSVKRDGTNRKIIVDRNGDIEDSSSDSITGIAIDWSARNLYWINIRNGVIEASRLDGSSRFTIISGVIGEPSSIAVDPHKSILVWGGGTTLETARLDGSNRKIIVSNALQISDISLDLEREHIYFSDVKNRTIERIDYNGTNRILILNTSDVITSIVYWNDLLYWIDGSSPKGYLKVAPIKNVPKVSILLETDHGKKLKDVQVFSPKRQSTKNLCTYNNGDCPHLCLFNGTSPLCAADIGKVNRTFSKDNDAIMFVTFKSINSIYTKDNSMQYTPNMTNSTYIKNAVALSFNYEAKRLFYSDTLLKSINSVFFNGTDYKVLIEGQNTVEGLVYEEFYNSLYWTSNNDRTISRANLTKLGTSAGSVEVLIKFQTEDKLRGITVDSCGGRLYWSNWKMINPTIESANLNGHDRRVIIDTEITMPGGITLDHKAQKLYWTDARLDKIERCEYDGTTRFVIIKGVPQHPFDIAVYGNYIYWTDWVLQAVIRVDKLTGSNVISVRKDVGYPLGIVAITNNTNECLKNACLQGTAKNGGCEQVCSLTPSGEVECLCFEGFTRVEDGTTQCYVNKI